MATVPVNPATNSINGAVTVLDTDEFGIPSTDTPAAATARHSWLGGEQRSAEALGGTILMGARLYHPGTGRFLSPDPDPGGNATAYDYCGADPINCTDLSGHWGWLSSVLNVVAQVAEVASWIPGPIGSIAAVPTSHLGLSISRPWRNWSVGLECLRVEQVGSRVCRSAIGCNQSSRVRQNG